MIVTQIENLINEIKPLDNIKEFEIPYIPPEDFLVGGITTFAGLVLVNSLYNYYSKVRVSPGLLKFYNPMKDDFFEFLTIVEKYTNEYSYIRSSFNEEKIVCRPTNVTNKEIKCLMLYLMDFQFAKIEIIISTLYNDNYDLISIRNLENLFQVKYSKSNSEFNKLIISLKNSLTLLKTNVLELNNYALNSSGIPLSTTYKDVEVMLNKHILSLIVRSINWK